jgi:hypothetical protein
MNKCNICRKEITPSCDWQQGRCPHRKVPLENVEKIIVYLILILLIAIIIGITPHV